MRGLFITGTNTGVGKTYVASLIATELAAVGHKVGVYKPVASGCDRQEGELLATDALELWHAIACRGELSRVCPQRFAAPLAPPLAAQAEGRQIDADLLREGLAYWRRASEIVIVEGAGGLMSPLTEEDYNADLAAEFGMPLVVVAPNELGTINATLQTLITASTFAEGLPIAGVVLNSLRSNADDPSTTSNLAELEKRCVPPVLAAVSHGGAFDRPVDWWNLAAPQ